MSRAWMVAVAAVMLLAGMGQAQTGLLGTGGGQSKGPYVVLAGVGKFDDAAIPERPTAVKDVRDLAKIFGDPQYYTTADRVIVLTSTPEGTEKEATKVAILNAFHEALVNTAPGDTIVLGLFGRGGASGENTCFLATDTKFADRATTAVLGNDLKGDLRAADDRNVCILTDIDFKWAATGKDFIKDLPTLSDFLNPLLNLDDGTESLPTKNKVMFLSTSIAVVPLTKGENGLFASVLKDGLTGGADAKEVAEGGESDGVVTVDELAAYLEKHSAVLAKEIGKTDREKKSTPIVIPNDKDLEDFPMANFALTKNPKATAEVDRRLKVLKDLRDKNSISAEVAAEGKRLIERMPKLKSRRELRKMYEAFADDPKAVDAFLASRGKYVENLKLPEDEARKFAGTTLQALGIAREKSIKKISGGEWAAHAVQGLYWKLNEPLPADLAALLKEPKTLADSKIEPLFVDARSRLGKREDLARDKDIDVTIAMMFAQSGDRYAAYYDKDTVKKIESQLRGEFRGIGIHIVQDLVQDGIRVVSPIKGSPAYRAGIKAGDVIVEVKRDVDPQGNPLAADQPRVISTRGMKTEKAVEIILGKVGVPVTVVVERESDKGEKERHEYTMKRALVSVETVMGVKRDEKDEWNFYVDAENQIAYICVNQFSPTTYRDLATALVKLHRTGLKGLVLDLRFNGGGLLDQAVAMCDIFIEGGTIVSSRNRAGEERKYTARSGGPFSDLPIAVLVNDKSASASEVVSACLQDNKRGVLVGERTYGKGSVQTVEQFAATGGELKLTIARYYPPSGRNIDKMSTTGKPEEIWGVTPTPGYEVILKGDEKRDLEEFMKKRELIGAKEAPKKDPMEKEAKPFEDRQLAKALEYLRTKTKAENVKPGKKAG